MILSVYNFNNPKKCQYFALFCTLYASILTMFCKAYDIYNTIYGIIPEDIYNIFLDILLKVVYVI